MSTRRRSSSSLELPRLASEVVEARPQACHASLELGQRLGRPPVGCLDLGQERGPARLDLLLDPAEISPEPVQILAEEGWLPGAPDEEGDHSGDYGQPAPGLHDATRWLLLDEEVGAPVLRPAGLGLLGATRPLSP